MNYVDGGERGGRQRGRARRSITCPHASRTPSSPFAPPPPFFLPGKQLFVLPLPIGFYLPLTEIQFRLEELEHAHLLDEAAALPKGSRARAARVAAFALSHYAATVRLGKPFLPMQGETFDIVLPERGLRVLGEAVVTDFKTQTVRHAWRADSAAGWALEADDQPVVGFKGTHLDFYLNWRDEIQFADGERFAYRKPTSVLGGLLGRKHTLTHTGTLGVRSSEGAAVDLTFHEPAAGLLAGAFGRGDKNALVHEVRGAFVDPASGAPLPGAPTFAGQWHVGLDLVEEGGASTRLWTPLARDAGARYDMTPFAARLNALTPALAACLPPTDSRRRPDLRALEEGRFEAAHALKMALERRLAAKLKGGCPPPRWFEPRSEAALGLPAGDNLRYRYKGGYWEARAGGGWDGCDASIFEAATEA